MLRITCNGYCFQRYQDICIKIVPHSIFFIIVDAREILIQNFIGERFVYSPSYRFFYATTCPAVGQLSNVEWVQNDLEIILHIGY